MIPRAPNPFHSATPILPVKELAASLRYYVELLGFAVDWGGPYFAQVSRGSCHLMLAEGDQGTPPTWTWVGVEDAAALHEEYLASGALVRNPPTNFSWALEMQVADPDGNVLRFGSEPVEGRPFGPWRDMRGVVWRSRPDGGWEGPGGE